MRFLCCVIDKNLSPFYLMTKIKIVILHYDSEINRIVPSPGFVKCINVGTPVINLFPKSIQLYNVVSTLNINQMFIPLSIHENFNRFVKGLR